MKDETNSTAIEEFAALSPKVHLFLIDDNREYKKAKSVNKYWYDNAKSRNAKISSL